MDRSPIELHTAHVTHCGCMLGTTAPVPMRDTTTRGDSVLDVTWYAAEHVAHAVSHDARRSLLPLQMHPYGTHRTVMQPAQDRPTFAAFQESMGYFGLKISRFNSLSDFPFSRISEVLWCCLSRRPNVLANSVHLSFMRRYDHYSSEDGFMSQK